MKKAFFLLSTLFLTNTTEQKIRLPSELIIQQRLTRSKLGTLNTISHKLGNQYLTPTEVQQKVRTIIHQNLFIKLLDLSSPLSLPDIDNHLVHIILEDHPSALARLKNNK